MGRSTYLIFLLTVCSMGAWGACAPEGPTAFITQNIAPDQACVVSPDATGSLIQASGSYDIEPGKRDGCKHSYRVNLLVNSNLRSNADPVLGRAEPNTLQISRAKVTLMLLNGSIINFNDDGANTRPNPFLTKTSNSLPPATGSMPSTAIAAVEVIPASYAEKLDSDMVLGGNIEAEIQIFGTTVGDVDIDVAPFNYTIAICKGCQSICASKLVAMDISREDLVGDRCDDNSGQDGRVCVDPDC